MLPNTLPTAVRSSWYHASSVLHKGTFMRVSTRFVANSASQTEVALLSEEESQQLDISRLRNKSKLNKDHYEQLHGIPPTIYGQEAPTIYMKTLRFTRRMYGKHGQASGVSPSSLWPTKDEFSEMKELEKVTYPHTLPKMIELAKQKEFEATEALTKRMALIEERIAKLDGWKQELTQRRAKKEAEARAAQEKKDRLYEEVRQFFGYSVDPKDERFKQMVEEKEKAEKKAEKEMKKQARAAKAAKAMLHLAKAAEEAQKAQSDSPGVAGTETSNTEK